MEQCPRLPPSETWIHALFLFVFSWFVVGLMRFCRGSRCEKGRGGGDVMT